MRYKLECSCSSCCRSLVVVCARENILCATHAREQLIVTSTVPRHKVSYDTRGARAHSCIEGHTEGCTKWHRPPTQRAGRVRRACAQGVCAGRVRSERTVSKGCAVSAPLATKASASLRARLSTGATNCTPNHPPSHETTTTITAAAAAPSPRSSHAAPSCSRHRSQATTCSRLAQAEPARTHPRLPGRLAGWLQQLVLPRCSC
jgi:hypothetical protein